MQTQSPVSVSAPFNAAASTSLDEHSAGVSWSAVMAGAAAAAALSFILVILGFGLGMSAVSPWSYSVETVGKSTIVWLAFSQLAAAGVGGYIAGRLRTRWINVHTDEVYFRDTAHGLLAWSIATLLTAALMAGAVRAVLGGAIDIGAATAAGADAKGSRSDGGASPLSYYSDVLLRSDPAAAQTDNGAARMEVERSLVNGLKAGALVADDRQYLSKLVAGRTGLVAADAEHRVDDVFARASKEAADARAAALQAAERARKGAAYSALWMFVALLIGAFCASLCATLGGKQRDRFARS